jgi:hypothetical protein
VLKQKIQVGDTSYELQEIYGIERSGGGGGDGGDGDGDGGSDDGGGDCVICMSEPKDTTVLPCRHMCLCGDCAKRLRVQTNRCPICRTPVESLLQIKVSRSEDEAEHHAESPGEPDEDRGDRSGKKKKKKKSKK